MIVSFPNLASHYSAASQVSLALPKTWTEAAPSNGDAVHYVSADGSMSLSIGLAEERDQPFEPASPPAYTDGFETSVLLTGAMGDGRPAAQVWVRAGGARFRFQCVGTEAKAVPAVLVSVLRGVRFISADPLPERVRLDRPGQTNSVVQWGWLSLAAPSGTGVEALPQGGFKMTLPESLGVADLGVRLERADNLAYPDFLKHAAARYSAPPNPPDGYTVLESGPMAIDRRPAVGATYEMNLPSGERVAIVEGAIWLDPSTILKMTGRCPAIAYTKAGPALGAIIGGMRVLKENGALRKP